MHFSDQLAHEIARIAIRRGGVLSSNHVIGLSKFEFMRESVVAYTLMALWRASDLLIQTRG
jgi:glycolate oxidase